jgi:hypothetical protein
MMFKLLIALFIGGHLLTAAGEQSVYPRVMTPSSWATASTGTTTRVVSCSPPARTWRFKARSAAMQ